MIEDDVVSDDEERDMLEEAEILLDLRIIVNKRPHADDQDDEHQENKRSKSNSPLINNNSINSDEEISICDDADEDIEDVDVEDEENSICEDEEEDEDVECDVVDEEQYCLPVQAKTEWWYQKCHYQDCRSVNTKLKQIAPPIKHSKSSLKKNYDYRAKMIRQAFREECLVRIGIKKNNTTECVRICYYHRVETVSKEVRYNDLQGNSKTIKVIMNVPVQYKPPVATHHRRNRGTGRFRAVYNRLKIAQTNIETATTSAERADLVERMMYQKKFGGEDNDDDNQYIDAEISEIVGITRSNNEYDGLPLKVVDYLWKRGGQMEFVLEELDVDDDDKLEKMETMYRPNKLTKRSNVVKENTGFGHVVELLSTTVIMSKGDINILTKQSTYLSWFEAWYLYYNVVYGRASYRWCDTANRFCTSKTTARKLHREKLGTCNDSKMSWPLLATCEEDKLFRKDEWNKKEYDNKRVIMHDNTNIDLCKPGCGEAQRLTYSSYYNGNVGKGSVSIQPCNWIATNELFMGAISDTDYIIKSKILETQQQFASEYDRKSGDVPWYNVLDRGYRVTHKVWKVGKQHVYQPTFASGTKCSTGRQTLRSGATAAVRSGNERAVNIIKHSHYLRNGLRPFESVVDLCDVWLAWGFQVNFMYKGVH